MPHPEAPGTTPAEWFGHPRGLATLFFTELWERFSFYGMRGLLVLFMTEAIVEGGLALDVNTATAIYGLYTAGVYLSALPGGWIADRLTGLRQAVFWGGVTIAAGHFTMAIPSTTAFFSGLVLIVIGTGLLKPNVSAIVGDLYPEGGARRDAGFSIYYMGINVGGFLGPLVCGYLGEQVDWHFGFGAAGVGMVLGLVQYRMGTRHLADAGRLRAAPVPEVGATALRSLIVCSGLLAAGLAGLWTLSGTGILEITPLNLADALAYVIVALAVVFFAYVLIFGGLTAPERGHVWVIVICFLGAAMFWSGFEQAGSSMNLFARDLTDRVLFGWEMPASWLQSVNSLFIIALAPVFSALWLWLGSRSPSIPAKFAYGLLQLGLGFLVLAWAALYTTDGGLVGPGWLVATYFFHTTGELCLSPIGLSSITKLSPPRFVGQMMGIWFMGASLGNLLAARVAGFIDTLPLPQLFGTVALTSAGFGLLLLAVAPPIRKLAGTIR